MSMPYRSIPSSANLGRVSSPSLPPLKFGCRMFAYMAPQQGEDAFIQQCLLTGGNSMQRQNQLPFGEPGDPDTPAARHHTETNVLKPGSPYPIKTGWGIAAFTSDASPSAPELFKSALPIFQDNTYEQTARRIAQAHPAVILSHLRESRTPGTQVEAHPFRIQNWAFMHHGDLSNQIVRELREELKAQQQAKQPVIMPQSKSDSELLACYFASRLLAETGTADTRKIQDKRIVDRIFTELVERMLHWPRRERFADIMTTIERNGQGENHPGSLNFVFSDGTRLLASNCVTAPNTAHKNYLQLGKRDTAQGTEYLLATYPMQPTTGPRIQWKAIPNYSILKLERQNTGAVSSIRYKESPLQHAARQPQTKVGSRTNVFHRLSKRIKTWITWLKSCFQYAWKRMINLFSSPRKTER